MVRYPHTLYAILSGEASQDNSGDFVANESKKVFISECREEPNGSGSKISLTDGNAYVFSSMIYIPSLCDKITVGTRVEVVNENGQIRFTGEIKRLSDDLKHVRLWA